MAYIVPQVLVYQDLEAIPAAAVTPLHACIIGPHYDLIRYGESSEKSKGHLGSYDPNSDVCYLWPNRPAGGVVDQDWTRLFMDDAWLQYWTNPSTVSVPASGDSNRVTASVVNFKDYETWARDPSLKSRDVQIGDGVRVIGGGYDILTKVTGFEHAVIASTVNSATADVDNQANTSASQSESQTAGDVNEVEIATIGAGYNGAEDGHVSETYTIEVTTGGAPGVARVRITSASGTDNVASYAPAAFGSPTDIGTRGLQVTWDTTGSGTDTPLDEFIVGQTWEVAVTQDYTLPTPASGGTYAGPADTSYVVTVVEGGDLTAMADADKPKISVSTTTGIDFGGPYTAANATPVALGNYGVTISLTGTDVVKGDRWIIPVVAEQQGPYRTLVLANALPAALQGTNVSVDLFIVKNIEVPTFKLGVVTQKNFTQSATEVCVTQAIQVTDPSWYEPSTGDEIALDVYQGELYVQYRSLLQTYATHTHVWTLADLPDQNTPDNPLVYAAFKALSNSNGTPVRVAAVPTNDLAGYQRVLEELTGRNDVYGLVPLTWDRQIQNAIAAHVDELSSAENGRWRICWLNSEAVEELGIYTDLDDNPFDNVMGDPLLAKIIDDDTTSGTQYTKVVIDDGQIITKGVESGDIVRANYGVDIDGNTTYESYVVDRVVSEDVLILVSGPAAAINVPSKIEIWRDLDLDEVAREYGVLSGSFGNRRVRHIWPDWVGDSGTNVRGYFLCAALAGLRSGVAVHQGLTNVEIAGFDDVSRTTEFFSKPQLDTMAAAGTWIVTQDFETGQVFTRHQLTTGDYEDQNQREDSVTTNLDEISYYMLDLFEPYIGKANVTPGMIDIVSIKLDQGLNRKTQTFVSTLGPQVISYNVREIRQHEVLRDRIVAVVDLALSFPFNNFELHLVI